MNRKEQMKKVAEETMQIIERGSYENSQNILINLKQEIDASVTHSVLITPKAGDNILEKITPAVITQDQKQAKTKFEVTNETSLAAAKRLTPNGKTIVLNFASAKNPGGGFLNGANAQEESLARSSALYASIIQHPEMYKYNRRNPSGLYSDYMIYSPDVPVFRDDHGRLLDHSYQISFITSPAVNAGIVRERREATEEEINHAMTTRIEKIIAVAIHKGYENIVLGAFGCGVFKNHPRVVANQFKEVLLNNPKYTNQFKLVTFAVLDNSPSLESYYAFKNAFNGR